MTHPVSPPVPSRGWGAPDEGGSASPGRGSVRGGGGLVEVLVALVVLEAGMLGVVGLLVQASRTLAHAAALERAVTVAGDVADSLLLAPALAAGGRTQGGLWVRWAPTAEGASVVVSAGEGGQPLLELPVPRIPEGP